MPLIPPPIQRLRRWKRRTRPQRLMIVGSIFVMMAVIGYMTVADDLRHTGELIGVTALLVVGIAFVVTGRILSRF